MSTTSPDILSPQRRSPAENLSNIKESLGEIAQVERERLHDVYVKGKERLKGVELRAEDYVREKPVRSLLIAAGVGATLGFLLGRRR